MSNLTRDEELQLREYAEAGNLCRSYEQLSRTSLAIYVAFSTAIVAVLVAESNSAYARSTLETIGILFSLFTLNVLTRVRRLYHAYVTRAREIEDKLGMDVYKRWDQAVKGSLTIPNKAAIILVITAFTLYFFALLVLDIRGLMSRV